MISLTAEYGLRAVLALARRTDPVLTADLADVAQVPKSYLYKVLRQLGQHGLVESQRGRGGGYRLAVSPKKLSVLDVVKAVDPPRRVTACPLKLKEHHPLLCPLHKRIDDALAATERAFAKTTIAELLTDRRRPAPLCGTRIKSR